MSSAIISINGKTADLAKLFPLKLGLLRALEEVGLLDEKQDVLAKKPSELCKLLTVLCQRLNKDFTPEDIDEMAIADLQSAMEAFKELGDKAKEQLNRPTATPSTS